ncbi:MAG: cyclic nucleotide-binding domain-containing protein, partial [Myxococcaceae bacterium]
MTKAPPDLPDFTPVTRVELRRADLGELVMGDELLRGAPVIKALGEDATAIVKAGIGRRYPDKVTVFRQGEAGASLFLVLKGEARLFAVSGQDTVEVGAAGKGEVFGEEEILGADVRTMSAIAAGELDAVELQRKVLLECAPRRPALLAHLKELQEKRRVARD